MFLYQVRGACVSGSDLPMSLWTHISLQWRLRFSKHSWNRLNVCLPQLGSNSRGSQGREKLGKIFNEFKQNVNHTDSKEI